MTSLSKHTKGKRTESDPSRCVGFYQMHGNGQRNTEAAEELRDICHGTES